MGLLKNIAGPEAVSYLLKIQGLYQCLEKQHKMRARNTVIEKEALYDY